METIPSTSMALNDLDVEYTLRMTEIYNKKYSTNKKCEILDNYIDIYNDAIDLYKTLNANMTFQDRQEVRLKTFTELNKILSSINVSEYLILDGNYKHKVDGAVFMKCLVNISIISYEFVVDNIQNRSTKALMKHDLDVLNRVVDWITLAFQYQNDDPSAKNLTIAFFMFLSTISEPNYQVCIQYLSKALFYVPESPLIHFLISNIHKKMNNSDSAILHCKLAITLNEMNPDPNMKTEIYMNCYNMLGILYLDLGFPLTSIEYLEKALKINEKHPDINNTIGLAYLKLKNIDLAETYILNAYNNYELSDCQNKNESLAKYSSNIAFLYNYIGKNQKCVEYTNIGLSKFPVFETYQNKMMYMLYVFDDLKDKMEITNEHLNINQFLENARSTRPQYTHPTYKSGDKIRIGIVSNDFKLHPVFYFITSFLEDFNEDKIELYCYLTTIPEISTTSIRKDIIKYKFITNNTNLESANIINKDGIHILLDLAGNTSNNRIEIFAYKPAPIQITYLGYPFTTGVKEMDYRITDKVCDNITVSQKFYSEKLIFMDNCFLCYNTEFNGSSMIDIDVAPYYKNMDYIVIGCFNRLSKLTPQVLKLYNDILMNNDKVILLKCMEFVSNIYDERFLECFDVSVRGRIRIVPFKYSYQEYLQIYNTIDLAIDSFPYCGTTTTCNSLLMGTPIFTFHDTDYYYHPNNVGASLLKNTHSELEFFICDNGDKDQIHEKIRILQKKSSSYWKSLKENVRDWFLNGYVCNKKAYVRNLEKIFSGLAGTLVVSPPPAVASLLSPNEPERQS
jgi:protein O-GlcNAc transferase